MGLFLLVDRGGRKVAHLPQEEVGCGTSLKGRQCRLCQQSGSTARIVNCDKCGDSMHLLCAIVQTFELNLTEKLDWYGSRPPTELDTQEVRRKYPKAWSFYEQDCHRLDEGQDFLCSFCHQDALMKDARTCVLCHDSYGQSRMIKCIEGRCVKGVHTSCWMAHTGDLTQKPPVKSFRCFTCSLQQIVDEYFPEPEDFLAGLFFFREEYKTTCTSPPKLLGHDLKEKLLMIQSCLENAQIPEQYRNRSFDWVRRWLGDERNQCHVLCEGIPRSVMDVHIDVPSPLSVRDYSDIDDYNPEKRKRALCDDLAGMPGELCVIGEPVVFPKIDPPAWIGYQVIQSAPASIDPGYLQRLECALDNERRNEPIEIPDSSSAATCESSPESILNVIQSLDRLVSLESIVAYLFPAIAREFDFLSVENYPHEARVLFDELHSPDSATRPKYYTVRRGRSHSIPLPRLQKLRKYHLYAPLNKLLLIYDCCEMLYGRGIFRLLFRHQTAVIDFLTKNAPWESVSELRSFTNLYERARSICHELANIDWWLEFEEELRQSRGTMSMTNLVITRCNRKFTDDQILDPFTSPLLPGPTKDHELAIMCRVQKVFGRYGFLPPISFERGHLQGIYLRADNKIQASTILGEYSGVLEPRRWNSNPLLSVSDSIYDLPTVDDVICIVPEPYTGIARYINGINNHIPEESKKVNVLTMTVPLNTGLHIVAVADSDVNKGQQLALDYNSGVDLESGFGYPTKNFLPID